MMNAQRFTLSPLAIAMSTALLFGCTADKSDYSIEPSSTQKSKEILNAHIEIDKVQDSKDKDKNNELRKRDDAAYRDLLSNNRGTSVKQSNLEQSQKEQPTNKPSIKVLSKSKPEAPHSPTEEPFATAITNQPVPGRILAKGKQRHAAVENSATGLAVSGNAINEISADMMHGETRYRETPYVETPYVETPQDREQYAKFDNNPFKSTAVDPLSTFGIDVDTASYTIARQDLKQGRLPRAESVRTEEWLNYFSYPYSAPKNSEQPFSVYTEAAPSPWSDNKHVLMIGLKGYEVAKTEIPPLNLTFLIDVSGSMSSRNKLPLAKTALKMLTQQLRPQDRVAIVVYAGAAGLILDSTPGNQQYKILAALDRLHAGGSTAGGAGIQLAYKMARNHKEEGAISRVILLSDGDFNVGTTSTNALKKMVEKERKTGISLSVLTFGRGNIRDELMNSLAEIGNGNAGYIDSALEAKKYLVDEMSGSLMTIAKDVKSQIEFNPAVVSQYRLLGYETRHLEHHEFNDDKKDAGEIGAGHEVIVLYELTLKGSQAVPTPQLRYNSQQPQVNPSRQGRSYPLISENQNQELAFLKLRYKQPNADNSILLTQPIYRNSIQPTYWQTSNNFRWATAVAGAAQKARGNIQGWNYNDSIKLARSAVGKDEMGYRAEFIRLMEMANSLEQPVQISRY